MKDMTNFLFYKVKYTPWLYSLYYTFGNLFIALLSIFVRPKEKQILFSSFGGRKFDDSPKKIYDDMLNDSRFNDYDLVWAFHKPEKFDIPRGRKIKTDNIRYFITVLQSRVCITNSSVERGLHFKGRNNILLNTWHGTPIKKMGLDIDDNNKSFRSKDGYSNIDIMLAQGEYEAKIFSRAFNIDYEKFKLIGLPRNDAFANYTSQYVRDLKSRLHLPNKKIILYAPTFREYDKTDSLTCRLSVPVDFDKWRQMLGEKYIVLFRAHYEISKSLDIKDNEFIRDVSAYSSLEDLMIVADILVSDYSSIFFDFSIMDKPMICFAFDYAEYSSNRGLYFDIRKQITSVSDEDALLKLLNDVAYNESDLTAQTRAFREKYVTAYGNASQQSLNIIYDYLNK